LNQKQHAPQKCALWSRVGLTEAERGQHEKQELDPRDFLKGAAVAAGGTAALTTTEIAQAEPLAAPAPAEKQLFALRTNSHFSLNANALSGVDETAEIHEYQSTVD